MNFWEFANNSPILTFFLVLIIGDTIAKVAGALFGRKK